MRLLGLNGANALLVQIVDWQITHSTKLNDGIFHIKQLGLLERK